MWKQILLNLECIVCNKSLQNIDHRLCEKTKNMGKIMKIKEGAHRRSRTRTPNWSPHERQYLLELIKDRKHVIMTKNTNGPYYTEEKDFAWNEILRMLIGKFGDKFIGRSIKKLKTQWQNMRKIARDEICLYGPSLEKFSRQSLEVCMLMDLVKDGQLVGSSKDLDLRYETSLVPAATETSSSMIQIKTECMDDDSNQPSTSAGNPVEQKTPSSSPCALIIVTPQTYVVSAEPSLSGSEDFSDSCEMETSEVPIAHLETTPKKVNQPTPKKVNQPTPKKVHQPTPKKVHQPTPKKVHQPTPKKVHQPTPKKVHQPTPEVPIPTLNAVAVEKVSQPTDAPVAPVTCTIETRKSSVSVMTEPTMQETPSAFLKPLQNDLQDFFKYTSVQKQLKMDMLKEERQVIKAMRETAELNKIIAEQKLKHVLWIKKQEMAMYSGEPGSGAGKGGGGGGAIREAGGAFGKMEAAREDEYFYKQQREQLNKLKDHVSKEINFHQDQIKRHEDAIRRHKESITNVDTK